MIVYGKSGAAGRNACQEKRPVNAQSSSNRDVVENVQAKLWKRSIANVLHGQIGRGVILVIRTSNVDMEGCSTGQESAQVASQRKQKMNTRSATSSVP